MVTESIIYQWFKISNYVIYKLTETLYNSVISQCVCVTGVLYVNSVLNINCHEDYVIMILTL